MRSELTRVEVTLQITVFRPVTKVVGLGSGTEESNTLVVGGLRVRGVGTSGGLRTKGVWEGG